MAVKEVVMLGVAAILSYTELINSGHIFEPWKIKSIDYRTRLVP